MTPSLLQNICIIHEGDNKKFDTKKKTIQNQKNKIKNILRSTLHAIKINNTNQKSFSQI